MNERLADQCEIEISHAIKRLLKISLEEVDLIHEKNPQYTSMNILLNMATGFLCNIAYSSIPKEARDLFIERLQDVVIDNFNFMDANNQ